MLFGKPAVDEDGYSGGGVKAKSQASQCAAQIEGWQRCRLPENDKADNTGDKAGANHFFQTKTVVELAIKNVDQHTADSAEAEGKRKAAAGKAKFLTDRNNKQTGRGINHPQHYEKDAEATPQDNKFIFFAADFQNYRSSPMLAFTTCLGPQKTPV